MQEKSERSQVHLPVLKPCRSVLHVLCTQSVICDAGCVSARKWLRITTVSLLFAFCVHLLPVVMRVKILWLCSSEFSIMN